MSIKTVELPGGVTVPEADYLNYLAQLNGFEDYKNYLQKTKYSSDDDDSDKPYAGNNRKILVHIIRR